MTCPDTDMNVEHAYTCSNRQNAGTIAMDHSNDRADSSCITIVPGMMTVVPGSAIKLCVLSRSFLRVVWIIAFISDYIQTGVAGFALLL